VTVALVNPPAPQRTGPGYYLYATMSGFPFQTGDFLVAQLIYPPTSTVILQCATLMTGLSFQQVLLGISNTTKLGAPFGTQNDIAQGATVSIFLEWERANLVTVDNATFTGFTYDTISQAWILAALAQYASSNAPAPVLTALQSTYSNSR